MKCVYKAKPLKADSEGRGKNSRKDKTTKREAQSFLLHDPLSEIRNDLQLERRSTGKSSCPGTGKHRDLVIEAVKKATTPLRRTRQEKQRTFAAHAGRHRANVLVQM